MQFPVFHRDELKENLFNQIGWQDPDLKQKLAITSYKLLYQILAKTKLRIIQVRCSAKPKILFDRFKTLSQKDRHVGHQDHLRLAEAIGIFQISCYPMQA